MANKSFAFVPIACHVNSNEKTTQLNAVFTWGTVVEEVRTVFERMDDATIYIPDLREIATIAS